ncbi:MAG: glycosyltransferase family 4 protein [Microthrixaceae bacterium]|nr:glycosyltransferase family 4 protein [Microthrixaceae bacterium]
MEDTQIVFNMGRQDAQKAHVDLIRAFAGVVEEHPRALLLIAGREGDATQQIRQALSETGIGDSVQFLGHRTDIADLLAAADVFVYPSRYEGLGGALIEAMAVGVPIIGSDAPAISEVLGHGRYGVIVERGDVAALGRAIVELLSDDEHRLSLRELGRMRFMERYELSLVIDQTFDLYRQTLGR